MANRLNVDSSILTAKARYEEWLEKWRQKWEEPYTEARLVAWWHQQPPAIHEQMAMQNPEAHAKVEAKVKEIEERRMRSNGQT